MHARRYAVWPEPRSRSRSLKGSRPSVPHGTNFYYYASIDDLIISLTRATLSCSIRLKALRVVTVNSAKERKQKCAKISFLLN